jgi:multimeric flavodoxin WrbA
MKILAIIGSPRKTGNTYNTVDRVKKNFVLLDENIDFEYLFLADCNLQTCQGCFACIARGEDFCPFKDDRNQIMAKMQAADGIILAAPTYAMGVPALMKNFIDRFAYTLHRPCFFDKVFLAVSTVGGIMGLKQTLAQLSILTGGGRLAAKIGLAFPPIPMPKLTSSAEKKIKRKSFSFYRMLQKPQLAPPGIGDFAYFHSFKQFTEFEAYREAFPADTSYYRGKKEYFYELQRNPLRRLTGKAVRGLMHAVLKFLQKNKEVKR